MPGDLWTVDFATGRRARLTFQKNVFSAGAWSPDGARIAYAAGRLGDTLLVKAASGLGDEQELLKEPGLRHWATSWSRDGRFLLYHTEGNPNTGADQWVLRLEDRKPTRLLGESYNGWAGVFSPDMRWIAYTAMESGIGDVYVRPFRVSEPAGEPGLGEGKWPDFERVGELAAMARQGDLYRRLPVAGDFFFRAGRAERCGFRERCSTTAGPASRQYR